ncbi:uncharacterized protein LOC141639035 [Silene latifolia]|uniref:uncharacterized protein LOC141639035 n=1 Tax=Silene latifolia TaxID=37657 RepID=UPI003D76EB42
MSGDTSTTPKLDPLSPYYLGSHDVPGAKISNIVLRRDNYDSWQKSMTFSLKARRKFGFIDGTIKKPTDAFELENWIVVNCTLVQWIRNMIDETLIDNISFPDDASVLWSEIKSQYAVVDGTMIHSLKTQLTNCKQTKGMDVTTYYGKLKTLWDAIGKHEPPFACRCGKCECGIGPAAIQRQDNERLHQFFMGLDHTLYGNIRSSQFQLDPLPALNRAYNLVLQEERLRLETHPEVSEVAIFATPHASTDWRAIRAKERNDKYGLFCSSCETRGHEIAKCFFKTMRFPEWWGDRPRTLAEYKRYRARLSNSRGSTSSQIGTSGVSGSSSSNAPGSTNANAGQADKIVHANAIITNASAHSLLSSDRLSGMCKWIIDTGASNHVTGTLSFLENQTCIPGRAVGLPNGQQVVSTTMGSVFINDSLTLHCVLFVPNLTCNLISVSQLILDDKLSFTFAKNSCLIQDPSSRKTIGAGELRDGLFWIDAGDRPLAVHTVTG